METILRPQDLWLIDHIFQPLATRLYESFGLFNFRIAWILALACNVFFLLSVIFLIMYWRHTSAEIAIWRLGILTFGVIGIWTICAFYAVLLAATALYLEGFHIRLMASGNFPEMRDAPTGFVVTRRWFLVVLLLLLLLCAAILAVYAMAGIRIGAGDFIVFSDLLGIATLLAGGYFCSCKPPTGNRKSEHSFFGRFARA